jgi:hypothetical protein
MIKNIKERVLELLGYYDKREFSDKGIITIRRLPRAFQRIAFLPSIFVKKDRGHGRDRASHLF